MGVLVNVDGMCLVRILLEPEFVAISIDVPQHEGILMSLQPFTFPFEFDRLQ